MANVRPNLLLLDEPTNNLDLDAVAALSSALQCYEGAVVGKKRKCNYYYPFLVCTCRSAMNAEIMV